MLINRRMVALPGRAPLNSSPVPKEGDRAKPRCHAKGMMPQPQSSARLSVAIRETKPRAPESAASRIGTPFAAAEYRCPSFDLIA